MPRPLQKAVAGEQLRALRAQHGVDEDPDLATFYGEVYLDLVPASLQPPGMRTLPNTQPLRPVAFDVSGDATLPSWVEGLGDRPVVYATLGTVFNRTPRVLELVIEALSAEDVDLIVTVGKGRDPSELEPVPANVHVETYIPQTLLFPHWDVVVSHGGFGTLIGAVTAGLPMYCMPVGGDQTFVAKRAEEVGIAINAAEGAADDIFGTAIDPTAMKSGQIREGVMQLLSDPSFKKAVLAIRAEVDSMPDAAHVATVLDTSLVTQLRGNEASVRTHSAH
jgi:MGT family glycosyltransferase